jgi:hypothetical protein
MEPPHLNNIRVRWAIFAALVLALPQVLLLQLQLISTTDLLLHLDRMVAMSTELENGYLWPRWSHYLHNGFGFPIFNYYAPGLYYLGAIVHALTQLEHDVILLLFIMLILFLRPVGAYLFARTFTTTPAALFAATVYTLTPMHFRELMVQGNIPQFAAIALLPFILWAFSKAIHTQRLKWYWGGSALFALAILLHHLTAFLFAPVLVVYSLIVALTTDGPRHAKLTRLSYAAFAIVLSLGLSAIYWIPTLSELHYTQINSQQDASFQIEENFIIAENLLALTYSIDRSWLNWDTHYGTFGPRLGLGHFLVLLLGLASVFRPIGRNLRLIVLACGISIILLLFMITPSAEAIWQIIPLIDYIQFPWRLLIIVAVLLIPVSASAVHLIPARWQSHGALALIAALFLVLLPMFYAPVTYMPKQTPTPLTGLAYETEAGNMGTTASGEYLPVWVEQTPFRVLTTYETEFLEQGRWRVWVDEGDLPESVQLRYDEASSSGSSRYHISAESPFALRFNQFYFPGWVLEKDGEAYPITPSQPEGLIQVDLAAGNYAIQLYYGGTTTQHLATSISLISLVLWGIGGVMALRQRHNTPPTLNAGPIGRRFSLVLIGMILALTLLYTAIITPLTDWFRPENGVHHPPAQTFVNVAFGDLVELIGYDLNQESFQPGEQVHVRLYWRLLNPGPRMLRSSVHLTGKDGRENRGGHNAYHIGAVPFYRWNPDQYVTDDHFFTVDENAAPFTTEIRVAVFDAEEGYYETSDGLTSLPLRTIQIHGDWLQADDTLTHPADPIDFGGLIHLQAYALEAPTADQPERYCLNVRWQVKQSIPADYTVMLHLVAPTGEFIQAADAPPFDGLYPTRDWQNGQTLDDRYCLQNPDPDNQLWLGLYDAETLTRVPIINAPNAHNALRFSFHDGTLIEGVLP